MPTKLAADCAMPNPKPGKVQRARITVHYTINESPDFFEINNVAIEVAGDETILSLKRRLYAAQPDLRAPKDQRMYRNVTKPELGDKSTMDECEIRDGTTIFLEVGRDLLKGVYDHARPVSKVVAATEAARGTNVQLPDVNSDGVYQVKTFSDVIALFAAGIVSRNALMDIHEYMFKVYDSELRSIGRCLVNHNLDVPLYHVKNMERPVTDPNKPNIVKAYTFEHAGGNPAVNLNNFADSVADLILTTHVLRSRAIVNWTLTPHDSNDVLTFYTVPNFSEFSCKEKNICAAFDDLNCTTDLQPYTDSMIKVEKKTECTSRKSHGNKKIFIQISQV